MMSQIKEPDHQQGKSDDAEGDCCWPGKFRWLIAQVPTAKSIHCTQTTPRAALKMKKRRQAMQFTPARKAAKARRSRDTKTKLLLAVGVQA